MTWFTKLALRLRKGQDGVALVVVISVAMVLLMLVTVAVSTSLSGVIKARSDQSWNSAIAAAYAGIEEYKSKIASDSSYYRYGNSAAEFSTGSTLTLPTGQDENPAFGIGTAGSWQTIGNDGSRASYRYQVDNSKYAKTGVIRIQSTGRVGDMTRSVIANIRQSGFIDFLYYTDYEIMDPVVTKVSASCVKYAYKGRGTSCGDIAFGGGDGVNGPMHSNDTIRICGAAVFTGLVTTSYNPSSGNRYAKKDGNGNTGGCSGESFTQGNPQYKSSVNLPETNTAMVNEVRTDLPADVPNPGCLYTGPTRIVFNSGGTMTVWSPWTLATRVAGLPNTSGSNDTSKCGTPGVTGLGSSSGSTIPVLNENLIFIQNVPIGNSGPNPNRWKGNVLPGGYYASTNCSKSNGLGYPISSEKVAAVSSSYGCRNGDVFVEGTLHGQLSINAENYIYVTDDLKYSGDEDDVLGLVSNNTVWVWNPVNSSGSNLRGGARQIDAAIISLTQSFQVQNYNQGSYQGKLTVNGAIAQKFRGPVATGGSSGFSTGYKKDYNYDERFKYVAPPKFLTPVTSKFEISVMVEVPTAYEADGSAILP